MSVTSWEARSGGRTDYLSVERHYVILGEHYGSGHTDNAGRCTHDEFLGGRWHAEICERFGKRVLAQALEAVREAGRPGPDDGGE